MGLEEYINKIIKELGARSYEISRILVIDKDSAICSSEELNLSEEEIDFATKIYVAVKAIEDAEKDLGLDFEGLIIKNAEYSIIVKRIADETFIMVKVSEIVSASNFAFPPEAGPKGTIGHINDAVEEIKAVLLEQ